MNKVYDSLIERQTAKEKSDTRFLLIVAVMIALFMLIITLNQFVFVGVRVEGSSMFPTLRDKDVLIVNRITDVKKGDIIVIDGNKDYWVIKRVIATEGDVVEFHEDGYVYINGTKYVDRFGEADYSQRPNVPFAVKTLAKDEVFYLGDNRLNSADSRDNGTCVLSQVVGVVESWSINNEILNALSFVLN